MPTQIEVNDLLKPILLKDLRIQCRARGLNPAGGKEALTERLAEHMMATGDLTLYKEFNGETATSLPSGAATQPGSTLANNYTRPEGQNVGNFLTDRPSSRVLAPPGGGTHFSLGGYEEPVATAKATVTVAAPAAAAPKAETFGQPASTAGNNYTRPEGQNVGNFLGDRPSSRVLAPPGGGSQITFG